MTSESTTLDANDTNDQTIRQNSTKFDTRANVASSTDTTPLTPKQRHALRLLLAGHTDQSVAKRLKIHRSTLWIWKTHHLAFRAELHRRRETLWSNDADALRALIRPALKVLKRHLAANLDRTSLRAAASVLRLAASHKLAPPTGPTSERELLRQLALEQRRRDNDPLEPFPEDLEEIRQHLASLCAQPQPHPLTSPDPTSPPRA